MKRLTQSWFSEKFIAKILRYSVAITTLGTIESDGRSVNILYNINVNSISKYMR